MKPIKIGHHFVIHCAPAIDIVLKPRLGALRGILTKLWSWFRQVSIGQRWSTWTDFNPKIWQLRTIWHRLNYSCFNFLVLRNLENLLRNHPVSPAKKAERGVGGEYLEFRILEGWCLKGVSAGLHSSKLQIWSCRPDYRRVKYPFFYASPIN